MSRVTSDGDLMTRCDRRTAGDGLLSLRTVIKAGVGPLPAHACRALTDNINNSMDLLWKTIKSDKSTNEAR